MRGPVVLEDGYLPHASACRNTKEVTGYLPFVLDGLFLCCVGPRNPSPRTAEIEGSEGTNRSTLRSWDPGKGRDPYKDEIAPFDVCGVLVAEGIDGVYLKVVCNDGCKALHGDRWRWSKDSDANLFVKIF